MRPIGFSVKDYFKQPERRHTRRVLFDKQGDRFNRSAQDRLRLLALPKDAGIYFTPVHPSRGSLFESPTVTFLAKVFHGVTQAKGPGDVWKVLAGAGLGARRSWVLEGEAILSFENLLEPPWTASASAARSTLVVERMVRFKR